MFSVTSYHYANNLLVRLDIARVTPTIMVGLKTKWREVLAGDFEQVDDMCRQIG